MCKEISLHTVHNTVVYLVVVNTTPAVSRRQIRPYVVLVGHNILSAIKLTC